MSIGDGSLIKKLRSMAAEKRSQRFLCFIQNMPRPVSILDLGGAAEMWQRWGISNKHQLQITLVNNHHIDGTHRNEVLPGDFIKERIEDVLDLSADDLSAYDVIFSNSMLEHLSNRNDQLRLAETIIKCRKPFFIQVPNKFCIVDPHFPHPFAPFFGAWPRTVQGRAVTLHRLGSGSRSPDYVSASRRMSFYTPISRRDLGEFFPKMKIEVEWSLGLPISLIASGKRLTSNSVRTESCQNN